MHSTLLISIFTESATCFPFGGIYGVEAHRCTEISLQRRSLVSKRRRSRSYNSFVVFVEAYLTLACDFFSCMCQNDFQHVAFRSFRNQQVAHNGVTAHSHKTENSYRKHLFIFCFAAPLRFALLRPLQVHILFPFTAIALLEFTKGAVCNHRSGATEVLWVAPKTRN